MFALRSSCQKTHNDELRYVGEAWDEEDIYVHSYYDATLLFTIPFTDIGIVWCSNEVRYTYDLETFDPCTEYTFKKARKAASTPQDSN